MRVSSLAAALLAAALSASVAAADLERRLESGDPEAAARELDLQPNATAADGARITLHFDPKRVPLRVALPLPETPAAGATPEQTRAAAMAGIREWERAIGKLQADFRIEFAEQDASAPIQAVWSDRPPGYVGGVGNISARERDGELEVGANLILSAKPLPGRGKTLDLGQVRANATHAFGGALGLGFCWECDSIRSMGWKSREAFLPTDLDIRTLEALWAVPNGTREEAPRESKGVLADLPFVNTGDDRHIFIDIAKAGSAPLVVQLDTGAAGTVMTPLYARALGVASRSVKSDEHRRDTCTGKPLLFWVTDQFDRTGGNSGWNYALLGGSFLESYVVEIDHPGRRVRLLDPSVHRVGGEPARQDEQVIELAVNERRPYVRVELGTGSALALLDTGSMGTLSTTEEVAAKLGIQVDPNAPRRQWINVMASSLASVQKLPVAKLGPVTLHDVELDIGLRGAGGVRIERTLQGELILGQGILRRFVVRIDYPHRKLGLTPVAR